MGARVLVMLGSESDRPVMQKGIDLLAEAEVDVEVVVSSAHRDPVTTGEIASSAEANGFAVIVCGARDRSAGLVDGRPAIIMFSTAPACLAGNVRCVTSSPGNGPLYRISGANSGEQQRTDFDRCRRWQGPQRLRNRHRGCRRPARRVVGVLDSAGVV